MPGIFLGLKFQACVFFWVCNNYEALSEPSSCMLRVPPPPPPRDIIRHVLKIFFYVTIDMYTAPDMLLEIHTHSAFHSPLF